jgi:glyoxalase family protein
VQLDGIHHISCITGDAATNLDFYTRVLGLRLVAKSVNQDDPYVYHLFYADYHGSPGADLTFFEYPGAKPGRAGAGMVHRIALRVPSADSLMYWADRLERTGTVTEQVSGALRFADPEGLAFELVVDRSGDQPLSGLHPDIPGEHQLIGFDHVVAYSSRVNASARVLEDVLGARAGDDDSWHLDGVSRHGFIRYESPPEAAPRPGGGTVHHVAWATEQAEHDSWLKHLWDHKVPSTPVIDRHYFRSIYFREPSGVLFELATKGPGFTVDDPIRDLGSRLILPPSFEPRRSEIEGRLTPLPNVARN